MGNSVISVLSLLLGSERLTEEIHRQNTSTNLLEDQIIISVGIGKAIVFSPQEMRPEF